MVQARAELSGLLFVLVDVMTDGTVGSVEIAAHGEG
jgi:hypothetical protein